MKLTFKFTFLLIIFLLYSSASAKKFPDTVNAEIVADTSQLETEGIIKLGVLYKVKPGWHIYWKNSGDSGLPTKIDFILPLGFEAGNLQWPIPEAYMRSGNVLDYGYENEVLLWTDVIVPPDYKKDVPIPVEVNTKWVSCEKICIPGKAEIKSEIIPKVESKNTELFNYWAAKLPKKNKNIDSTIKEMKIKGEKTLYTITLNFEEPVQNIEFFPIPGRSLEIEDITYSSNDSKTKEIKFKLSVYPGKVPESDQLDSVVAYTDSKNIRKGIEFPINISDLNVNK